MKSQEKLAHAEQTYQNGTTIQFQNAASVSSGEDVSQMEIISTLYLIAKEHANMIEVKS